MPQITAPRPVCGVVCVFLCLAVSIEHWLVIDRQTNGCVPNQHSFNGPLSETIQVSRYQKGKTNLDFTEARDSEWQRYQLGHMQVCTSLQTDNHTSTPPLSFLQARCPSCRPTNSVKTLRRKHWRRMSQTTPRQMRFGWLSRMGPRNLGPSALQVNSASTPGSLNRVPASAGVRAGMSPLPGGR